MRIVSMSSVDIKNMEFTLTMYFRQFWTDHRLARPGAQKNLSLHFQSHRLWKPDTFFRNSKKGERHMMTEPNILMRIAPNGYITYSQKLTVTFSCLMRLQFFPMDNQACGVNIGSYSYSLDEVRLRWKTNTSMDVTMEDTGMQSLEFLLPDMHANYCDKSYNMTGPFNCLQVTFILHRQVGFYVFNMFAPFILIVVISWAGFWIHISAVPARITIVFLTILSVITHNTGLQLGGFPRAPYVKAIDVFMIISMIFVIAALFEFSLANYLFRHNMAMAEQICVKRKKRRHHQSNNHEPVSRTTTLSELSMDLKDCPTSKDIRTMNDDDTAPRILRPTTNKTPPESIMDIVSRFLFPFSYAVTNLVYWLYYTSRYESINFHQLLQY